MEEYTIGIARKYVGTVKNRIPNIAGEKQIERASSNILLVIISSFGGVNSIGPSTIKMPPSTQISSY